MYTRGIVLCLIMEDKLTINKEYAARYAKKKQAEELSKLRDKYGAGEDSESGSSSSEEEDDDAEGVTPQVERDFLRTLSLVRSRDPSIYETSTKFYSDEAPSAEQKKKPQPPMFLKDYERKRLLERGSLADVSDSESTEETTLPPSYSEEQQMLKERFKEAVAELDSRNDEFLSLRVKTEEEEEGEEREYAQWLTGQKATIARKEARDMATLHRCWTDPALDPGEAFLRDYILKRGYIDQDTERVPTYDELVADSDQPSDSEDEVAMDKQEEFERKFNFRYEEPEGAMIATYPRTVSGSVRREDDVRKKKRTEREERKAQEKERKREELKRLKNLKKKEIMAKLEKLNEATGTPSVGFREEDLEGDFDPTHYDEIMCRVFNEQYDSMPVDTEKPVFSDSEGEDQWRPDWEEGEEGLHCEDRDFNMDAEDDGTEQQPQPSKKPKIRGFAAAMKRSKPTFDPSEKSFEEYLDEYYQLDYEDMIGGDLPCRFKYRSVPPNDFGLSTEEVLACNDKELNRWASLKKAVQHRTEDEEDDDQKRYCKKGRNRRLKHQILTSLQEQTTEDQPSPSSKKRRLRNGEGSCPSSSHKHKQHRPKAFRKGGVSLSKARLKSYGLSKKKRSKLY